MRKCIISMNLSLDGFMAGPDKELDWHFDHWHEAMGDRLLEQLEKSDTLLLGRTTYEAMSAYWPFKPLEQDFPRQDLAIADKMNRLTKIVFSKTCSSGIWYNTIYTARNIEEEISLLRSQKGKNMLLFGSGTLASAFIQSKLADEFLLWIHPVILGKGYSLFKNGIARLNLILIQSVVFESGVILLIYQNRR